MDGSGGARDRCSGHPCPSAGGVSSPACGPPAGPSAAPLGAAAGGASPRAGGPASAAHGATPPPPRDLGRPQVGDRMDLRRGGGRDRDRGGGHGRHSRFDRPDDVHRRSSHQRRLVARAQPAGAGLARRKRPRQPPDPKRASDRHSLRRSERDYKPGRALPRVLGVPLAEERDRTARPPRGIDPAGGRS